MQIMVANNASWWVHHWATRIPGSLGHLWSPGRNITCYPHLDFHLDNGIYPCWDKGIVWDAERFKEHCHNAMRLAKKPGWIVVPDVRLDAKATLKSWQEWEPQLRCYGVPLAFAMQNGMQVEDIPESANVLFIGGSDDWRYPRMAEFAQFARSTGRLIHVGRVNSIRRIQQLEALEIDSVDGTGWFRGNDYKQLEDYFRMKVGELESPQQFSLFGDDSYQQSWATLAGKPRFFHQRIPKNITREHLLQALARWETTPERYRSTRWGVLHEGQLYAPKLLIARANLYANGQFYAPHLFHGGKEANGFLRQRGFDVVKLELSQDKALNF